MKKIPTVGSQSKYEMKSEGATKQETDQMSYDVSAQDADGDLEKMSLFDRLFAPDSMESDVSEDSQFDSVDSRSQFSDTTESVDEEEDVRGEGDDSTGEPSATSTLIKFDRDLRARHRTACKNMTVRTDDWNGIENTSVAVRVQN